VPTALLVIVNPTAGGGRAGRLVPSLRERLGSRPEARLEITTRAGHAELLAAEGAPAHDRIVAVGGDGTVQEIINGMLASGEDASLGIVPTGSGNDLARSLGLPRDPAAAWSIAVGEATRSLDLALASGSAGERWFGSAGGIGFDAQVAATMARRRSWQSGRAGYLLSTLAELGRFNNREIELTVDGVMSTRTVLFVAIANGEFYGGGMRIAPGAATDDGLLDICIVGDISRATALRQLLNLYRGTHVAHPQVELLQGRSISIDGGPESLVHLDGEPFGGLPARIELHPARLSVAVPR
jgi:diacylglycerol kinase (ATP)